jgi:hypothetical protein
MSEGASFVVGGKEFPIKKPQGKKGRAATAYMMKQFGGQAGEIDVRTFFNFMGDPEFERHLPGFIGVDAAFLEENGDTMEVMDALTSCMNELFSTIVKDEEVEEALGNSQEPQEA